MSEPQRKFQLNPNRLSEAQMAEIARATLERGGYVAPGPGLLIPSQGVYLGQYSPKDRDGQSLGKIFNVFAAPEDLPGKMEYVDAVKHLARLKKWHGFDGTNYPTDKEIYAALKDGSYNGGWIIPTRDILHGKDVDDNPTTPDNLFDHQNAGTFRGTFKTVADRGSDWYWSSTARQDDLSEVRVVRFSDGDGGWAYGGGAEEGLRSNCRPVRLVEVQKP